MSPETFARYAGAALPRYTSYPTAPHFAPLAEAEYRAWLSGIAPGDALSLYVHIPFCRSLCWYCGCHTAVTRLPARLARYTDGLLAEAALLAAALPAHGGVSALHLGGGTPSAIGAEGLSRLLAALRAHFPFRDNAELAIELDPRVLTPVIADALAEGGITRASLGVQDIDPEVQARIGRIQPSEQVARAVALLRERGIGAINLDLMYGLPGQGVAEAEASARFAAELGADRVAVFGYAHVPWMKPAQNAIDARQLPGGGGAAGPGRGGGRGAGGGGLPAHRPRPFRPAGGSHGPRRGGRGAAPQLPGLHHGCGAGAARARRLLDRPAAGGLRPEHRR
ncbi:radical SAM protein [Pseudoroseomonas cervicalis]|uniref:radical SAM protein n=1 Tax=Teichococcus cervicalis TaxID=204525 RepID=UPI0035EA9433